jgi:putative aldouronate transport system substrate-binding protein
MNTSSAPNFSNYKDMPFYQGLSERTGIKVTYLQPALGTENEQFNLIVASGDFPDIFDRNFISSYPGGPEKAISDKVILRLNDILDRYAPNLKDVLTANQDYNRMLKTDSGSYYTFPFIRGDIGLCIYQGLQIRKDWLDELGLKTPVTYNDWRETLTAFKTRKNSPAPLAVPYNNAAFMHGYGFDKDFYRGDDGKAQWGRIQPAYRDYLTMMNQWYREGLLDPDFASLASQQIATKITTGVSGVVYGLSGGNMGAWLPSGREANPNFNLMGVKNPVRGSSDKLAIIIVDPPFGGTGTSISGTSKNPEIAARLLDYGYSREGSLYSNFGAEGVSYNMINGYPTYTDLILKNPRGWPIGQALSAHARASYDGPFVQALEYLQQYLSYPEQKEAIANWTIDDPFKHRLPPITPSPEESQEIARIMGEINSYADEMLTKFILGTEPLSGFDAYVNNVRRMGIDRAIEIQNAALARYNAR